jgi:hypothetical protein
MTEGLANYILGSRKEVLIVVMDNVDRLDLKNQLDAFQLSLWFMQKTRAFVILQMRDETYERFKNKPPLDTFRSGIVFHITAPRFLDVVKKRLDLTLEYLEKQAKEHQTFVIDSGARVSYHRSQLQHFLTGLYRELFDRKRNISRVLEALAGRDVRRALEMFVSIITSGHLKPEAIMSTSVGAGGISISEHRIIKILMRTDYAFFSDNSGFVSNIFFFEPDWEKPDNFLLIEILFFLSRNRKKIGQLGLEGYFSCKSICDFLQKFGYVPGDVLKAINLLLNRQLIAADHMNFDRVGVADCVRVLAAGFIHVRVLSNRSEYLYGVIPSTPFTDKGVADKLADTIKNEAIRGDVAPYQKANAVGVLLEYLETEEKFLSNPFIAETVETGRQYVLSKMREALEHFRNINSQQTDVDILDF